MASRDVIQRETFYCDTVLEYFYLRKDDESVRFHTTICCFIRAINIYSFTTSVTRKIKTSQIQG